MELLKLQLGPHGNYLDYLIPNKKMYILAWFLASDIGCPSTILEDWILDDKLGMYTSGNLIALEKEGNYIYLSNMYDEDENPTLLKISRKGLIALLHDWQEKICKLKPKNVIIKNENGTFTIETE